jgi:hypothetical protein
VVFAVFRTFDAGSSFALHPGVAGTTKPRPGEDGVRAELELREQGKPGSYFAAATGALAIAAGAYTILPV